MPRSCRCQAACRAWVFGPVQKAPWSQNESIGSHSEIVVRTALLRTDQRKDQTVPTGRTAVLTGWTFSHHSSRANAYAAIALKAIWGMTASKASEVGYLRSIPGSFTARNSEPCGRLQRLPIPSRELSQWDEFEDLRFFVPSFLALGRSITGLSRRSCGIQSRFGTQSV